MSAVSRRRAHWDLWLRYKATFAHHWRARNARDGRLFTAHEAEFLPAALALQERPVSPVGRLVAWVLMAMVAIAVLWAVLGRVDIVVTARGRIIPSARTKTLASVEVASVRAIHVKEGLAVKAGDLLVELDASQPDAEHDKAASDQREAMLEAARARALIQAIDQGHAPILRTMDNRASAAQIAEAQRYLDSQYADFRAKLERIDGDIARYSAALPLITQQARDYQALSKDHDVAPHLYLEKEQARIEMEGSLRDARNQRTALVTETRKAAFEAMTEGGKLAGDAAQDVIRAGAHSRLMRLTSPVDGTVQQLTVHTVGGVVAAAQPLMNIVPAEGAVEVEATVQNKDVGFVKEGQSAQVKLDAFPYTRYGTIAGRVTHLSHDSIPDEQHNLNFAVKVALDQATMQVEAQTVALAPGMSVGVEIKTGSRRVIEYLLNPLMAHGSESLHER